ncbi:protoheme IX farnesyltransferase [Mariprofundus ferrinatatus]|uniref:Protoheme IX farnesyltransferase n=1 Tax=Mariprofundus ferrinatatus TaxID=1921087 RepID=A0A2K8L6V3_9PROT|nr:heme o synthase [Mariprofundus ferrinatatus]ATX81571.1 protoheme IX farnesyltransferase [Mariprofundus ferrinatatus]
MSHSIAEQQVRVRSAIADYVSLSKPGIVGLTLVAALTGIYFGNHGVMPHWHLIGWTFLTLGLATAGSCMLNNHYDRDIDQLMKRTSNRALAAGAVSANRVLYVSLILTVGSLALMAWAVNPLTAVVTGVGVVGYVGVYTMWMKRRTPWANQFGGIAGAVPPMVGYAAVTNELGAAAWILFAIMVVWQQPHALSLALKYRGDYARAKVPVIPVACGVYATKLRILLYTIALIPVAMTPWYFDIAGSIYLAASVILSAIFLFMAVRFYRSERDCDMRVFAYSIVYLILLFGTMVIDSI